MTHEDVWRAIERFAKEHNDMFGIGKVQRAGPNHVQ